SSEEHFAFRLRSDNSRSRCPYLRRSLNHCAGLGVDDFETLQPQSSHSQETAAKRRRCPESCAGGAVLPQSLQSSIVSAGSMPYRSLRLFRVLQFLHERRILVISIEGIATRRQPVPRRGRAIAESPADRFATKRASAGSVP